MRKLLLASNNAGKLAEFSRLLATLNIDVMAQGELNVPECDEPFFTFVENALHKARHAARITGLPTLADDSGVCVRALGGAPGVFSARYASESTPQNPEHHAALSKDERNNQTLIQNLATHTDKSAYYYCVLVLVRHADDPQPIIADAQWHGQIIDTPRGSGGFGYDPHFYLPELDKTVAELDKAQKNTLSHRGQAVQLLLDKLKNETITSKT